MSSTEMIDIKSLAPGSLIDVETKSRHYRIECLGGSSMRISGHPDYCPEPVPARLQGSFDKRGELEPGLIGRGKHLQFLLNDWRPVTTTRILHLHVERAKGDPKSSQS